MSTSIYFNVEYVLVNCGANGCDQTFGMSRDFYNETHRKNLGWTCPRGHSRIWSGKTTEVKLSEAQAREVALRDQLEASIRETEKARSLHARDRQRIANGACPCCNRYFDNVRRHMSAKHPEYAAPEATPRLRFECGCGRSFDTYGGLRIHQGRARSKDWSKPGQLSRLSHLTVGATR